MNHIALSFQDELNQQTINLPRAALLYARAIAYPILDVDHYLKRLNSLAEQARPRLADCPSMIDRVDMLSDFLFGELEFHGNHESYYDPRNSYLNCVIDRKTGIPITLSLVYIHLAQQLGLRAYGVGLPGHFVVGVYDDGRDIYLDPFNAGRRLTLADCARLVNESKAHAGAFQQKWLAPVSPTNLLARMLTNLCNAYVHQEDWSQAIPVIQHLLMVQPDTDYHLRDLGYLYMYNGSMRLSAFYLEEYLRRAPEADDFDHVRSSLQIVAGRLALWN